MCRPGGCSGQFFQPLSPWNGSFILSSLFGGFNELCVHTQYKCLRSSISFLVSVFRLATSQSLTGFIFIKASPWLKFPPLCAHSHLTRWMRECNTARISAVGPSSATPELPWLNLCVTSALQWRGTLFPWILFYKEAIYSLGRHYIDLLPNMPWIPILPLFTAEVIIADGVQSAVFLSCTFPEVTALLLEATVHPVDFTAIDEVWN